MPEQNRSNFEDPFDHFRNNPNFQKAKRLSKPRFDVIKEILKRRTALGLTQKDLAKLSNTHQSRISKIESGEHDIRLSTLVEIAEALKATVEIKFVPFQTYTRESEHDIVKQFVGFVSTSNCTPPLEYVSATAKITKFVAEAEVES